MRALLVLTILSTLAVSAASRHSSVSTAVAFTGEQPGPSQGGTIEGPEQVDLIKWAVTQGGLTLLLLLVLLSYRRDFFRRIEQKADELAAAIEEKRDMKALIRENSAAMQAHAIAVVRNTDATERLAESVDKFAERRALIRRDGDAHD